MAFLISGTGTRVHNLLNRKIEKSLLACLKQSLKNYDIEKKNSKTTNICMSNVNRRQFKQGPLPFSHACYKYHKWILRLTHILYFITPLFLSVISKKNLFFANIVISFDRLHDNEQIKQKGKIPIFQPYVVYFETTINMQEHCNLVTCSINPNLTSSTSPSIYLPSTKLVVIQHVF